MIKLFTHTDLDGVGCSIIAQLAFGTGYVDVEYCNYDDINQKVMAWLTGDEYHHSNTVFITDISVNAETAEYIASIEDHKIKLIDHHLTSDYLNKYDWATVKFEVDGEKTCGTSLFYTYLLDEKLLSLFDKDSYEISVSYEFTEIVRKYDTWLWKEKYNDIVPKQWNDLLHLIGREAFIGNTLYTLTESVELYLTNEELDLLRYKQKEIDSYILKKGERIIRKEILGYKAGVVFAEMYISELGNTLAENNKDLDFIAIINMSVGTVSYRAIKEDINLGKDVAAKFYGGGHPKAAGSELPNFFGDDMINKIFGL